MRSGRLKFLLRSGGPKYLCSGSPRYYDRERLSIGNDRESVGIWYMGWDFHIGYMYLIYMYLIYMHLIYMYISIPDIIYSDRGCTYSILLSIDSGIHALSNVYLEPYPI